MPGAFYQTTLGDWELTIIQDGRAAIDPTNMAVNATPEQMDALLAANGLNRSIFRFTINVMLIEGADHKILIDTGNGGQEGALLRTLGKLEVDPASITHILISHSHMDHIGGLSDDVTAAFPNATVMIGTTEYEAKDALLSRLTPYRDRLRIMPDSGEWLPGITAIPAFGHTPGHTVFLLKSGDASLLLLMDAANNNVISLAHPEWAFRLDADPEMAARSRRMLLEKAADEKLRVFGYHFAFPGIGFMIHEGDGFRYVVLTP